MFPHAPSQSVPSTSLETTDLISIIVGAIAYSRFTHKWDHAICSFCGRLTQHTLSEIHSCGHNISIARAFGGFRCVAVSPFVYPFSH